jgi:hypothetical protein
MSTHRNILQRDGRFIVRLKRGPRMLYGGCFRDLVDAIVSRNRLEALVPAKSPGRPRHAIRFAPVEIRDQRRETGLCTECGQEPPIAGRRQCRGCRAAANAKRQVRLECLEKGEACRS